MPLVMLTRWVYRVLGGKMKWTFSIVAVCSLSMSMQDLVKAEQAPSCNELSIRSRTMRTEHVQADDSVMVDRILSRWAGDVRNPEDPTKSGGTTSSIVAAQLRDSLATRLQGALLGILARSPAPSDTRRVVPLQGAAAVFYVTLKLPIEPLRVIFLSPDVSVFTQSAIFSAMSLDAQPRDEFYRTRAAYLCRLAVRLAHNRYEPAWEVQEAGVAIGILRREAAMGDTVVSNFLQSTPIVVALADTARVRGFLR
jgi:hypothetical protein